MKTKNTKAKSTYGTGSIYYVESRQRYAGAVTLDINGTKKRKTVYGKTKSEVRSKMLELQVQAKAGNLIEKDCTTIYQLADKMIEEQLALNEIKQSSYDARLKRSKS